MCYSAIVGDNFISWAEYAALLDGSQTFMLLSQRLTDPSIKVTKGFEANFDHPKTEQEARIKAVIEQYRGEQGTKLQQEVFAQKKRLADADRKLLEKHTKSAFESKRIAESKIEKAMSRLSDLNRTELKTRDHRIFPFIYAPIIIQENGQNVVKLARYHLRQPRQSASVDRKYPGLYNARRDNIEKFWREEFGVTHALMIVDSFYENVDREGKNAVLHFVPTPAEPMLIACLYGVWHPGQSDEMLSFAAVTDEPPPEVSAAGHDRCIVNLKPENVEKWLTPQGRSTAELQAILEDKQRPYYEHELMAA